MNKKTPVINGMKMAALLSELKFGKSKEKKEGMKTQEEIENKSELAKLVGIIKEATVTYKNICTNYADARIDNFIDTLTKNHKGFIRRASKFNINKSLPIKNQLSPDASLSKDSAIDILLLCMDMERKILTQAREAVHSCNGSTKRILCQQLTYSENALFKADQMLENYE